MFDRSIWAEHFNILPGWPCPLCADGRLQSVEGGAAKIETGWSLSSHSEDFWEPDWTIKRFSTHLKCSDTECGEGAVVIGTIKCELEYDYDYDYDGQTTMELIDIFYPELIHPAPSLIHLVDDTPQEVVEEVYKASSLIWLDTSSSANKLRLSAERVLTALKVNRSKVSNGKRRSIMLADRIKLLGPKHKEIAELLQSIRFLGNHGSHENKVSVDRNDLLNAFEIMEHIIEKAFSKKAERVRAAAKEIKKRKGKPPARRQRSEL